MPIEDIFTISAGDGGDGPGGAWEGEGREEVELVGLRRSHEEGVTGVEMFKKLLDEGVAGDNIGFCFGARTGRRSSGDGAGEAGSITPHTKFKARFTC